MTVPQAAFTVSVSGGSRSVNAVSVAGASVTLTLASAAQAGDTVTVDYAKPNGPDFIRDTQGRVASSFSGRAVSNDTPATALTATIHGAPESHDGQEDFTFELRFSEEPKTGFSYETLRDHAFTVTRGAVEGRKVDGARRLVSGSNICWEISVSQESNGDITVVLPITTDCTADGAICTDDGKMLSGGLQLAVPGPNTPATGAPTITGTAQVGETLTASTTGISDADGMTSATFRYQWLVDDAEIDGATASAYTLADADEDKAVKVQVSFTDDRGNDEILTSAATEAVQPRPNSPVIRGTARVGETLTADTSEIYDPDGLQDAVFAYQWLAGDAEINGATASAYTLVDADEGKAISVQVSFTDDRGNEESLTSAATGAAAPLPNTPATGAPTISGTTQVGETLTAGTSNISDGDGLDDAAFAYQWLADDAEINGATASAYTLAGDDEGKAVKVRVSFNDDAGNYEALTSQATAAVAEAAPTGPPPAPQNLTATVNPDGSVTLSWYAPQDDSITGYRILRRRPTEGKDTLLVYVADTQSATTTYTDTNVTQGVQHAYRVKAINAVGLSRQSNFVNVTP